MFTTLAHAGIAPAHQTALHDRGALEHEADIAKAQGWLGHANISTTCLYDRRGKRAEDSLVYKVKY